VEDVADACAEEEEFPDQEAEKEEVADAWAEEDVADAWAEADVADAWAEADVADAWADEEDVAEAEEEDHLNLRE